MAWNSAMTNAAIEMWNQVPTGESIHSDYAAGGAGTVSPAALMAQTELVQKKQVFSIVDIKTMDGGQRVNIQIDNSGLAEGYVLRQIGIWGHLTDGDPQMIAILQDEDDHGGINIPSEAEVADFSLNFYALLKVSGDSEITLEIDSTALVSMATLEETLEGYAKTDHTHDRFDRLTIGDRLESYTGTNDGLTVGDNNIASGVGVTAMGRQNIALYGSVVDITDVDEENNVLTLESSIATSRVGQKAVLWAAAVSTLPAEVEILSVDDTGKIVTVSEVSGNYRVLVLPLEQLGTSKIVYSGHAEGSKTVAVGQYGSHAEGTRTIASGVAAHAEGNYSRALGSASHAEGTYTIAKSSNQHVQGKYNISDTAGTYAHIVGNGTSDNKRNNAHTLDWEGNAWYSGDIQSAAYGSMSEKKRYASVVIGTTQNGHTLADCDYLCDGVDDQDEITQALAELSKDNSVHGGQIIFLAGVYSISKMITVPAKNHSFILSGQGPSTIFLDSITTNSHAMIATLTSYSSLVDPTDGVVIENICFMGKASPSVNEIIIQCNACKTVIRNCLFKGCGTAISLPATVMSASSAYVAKYGAYQEILDNVFYSCSISIKAITYNRDWYASYSLIKGNLFYALKGTMITGQNLPMDIIGNTFVGQSNDVYGITIPQGKVSNNTFVGTFHTAVTCTGYKVNDDVQTPLAITGNTFSGNMYTAIYVNGVMEEEPLPVSICGNTFSHTYVEGAGSTYAIKIQNSGTVGNFTVSISGNSIKGFSNAVYVYNLTEVNGSKGFISIVGNTIEDPSMGINLSYVHHFSIIGNVIRKVGTTSSSISLNNSSKGVVLGNVVFGDDLEIGGISASRGNAVTISDNVIRYLWTYNMTNLVLKDNTKY